MEQKIKVEENEKRKIHLDMVRILAIFLVIFNHTNEKGFFLFAMTENAVTRPIYTAMSILCTIAVPLFFMVSGALLLKKEESVGELFKKRVSRIVLVILVFSIAQEIYFVCVQKYELNISEFLRTIVQDRIIIPYWYLYAYLAFLMMLPFFRKLVCGLEEKEYKYFFGLYIVLQGIAPIFCYFFKVEQVNLFVPLLEQTIFYPILGYYLEYKEKEYERKNMLMLVGASIIVVIILTGMTWIRAKNVGELSEFGNGLFLTGLTAIPAVTVYYGLNYFGMHHLLHKRISKILQWISRDVFTIYLIEERVREMTEEIDELLIPVIGWMPSCIVWIFCIVIICIAIAEMLRRIPGLKKIL